MGIDQVQREIASYGCDAENIINYVAVSEPRSYLLERTLSLIQTYLQIPRSSICEADIDGKICRLAVVIYYYAQPRGYWNEIESLWSQLHHISSTMMDDGLRTELLTQLAIVRHNQGDRAGALRVYTEILQHPGFGALPPVHKANALHQAGICYLKSGQNRKARVAFLECLNLTSKQALLENSSLSLALSSEERELFLIRLQAHHQLANLHLYAGRFKRARQAYQEVLAGYQAIGEGDNLAAIPLYSLGRLSVIQRRFGDAVPPIEAALIIRKRRQEVDAIAGCAIWLAAAYAGVDRFEDAETLINEASRLYRSINHSDGILLSHLFSGILAARRGEYREADAQWHQVATALGIKASATASLVTAHVLSSELLANRSLKGLFLFWFRVLLSFAGQKIRSIWPT